ncbi:MAG: CHAT domain-containing tetratricopeptide repeat protein [Blastocatellia bacterium]
MKKGAKIAGLVVIFLAAIFALFLLSRTWLAAKRAAKPVAVNSVTGPAAALFAEAERLAQVGGLANYQAALEQYKRAGKIWGQAGALPQQAQALRQSGNLHRLLGEQGQALAVLQQALTLAQQGRDPRGEADACNDLSLVYLQRGEREQAQEFCARALQLSEANSYREGQAQALTNQGEINNALEKPEDSLRLLNTALSLWRALGEQGKQAYTYSEIGASYFYLGQYAQAIESRTQALRLFQQVNDLRGQARALTLLGHLYSTIGDKQEALRQYRLAAPLLEKAGDRRTEASLASGMSFVYTELGEPQKALTERTRALELVRLIGDREGEAVCLMHSGELQQLLGQTQEALRYLQDAQQVAQAIKDRRIEAQVLHALGVVYQARHTPEIALQHYQQALALYPPTYSPRWKAYAYNSLGEIHAQARRYPQAIAAYQQALDANLAARDRFGESQTRYHFARLHASRKNYADAMAQIKQAVTLIESLRANVFRQDLRTSYFASVNQVYELYRDILMHQHDALPQAGFSGEALTVNERARARSLLDLLHESQQNIKQGVAPALLEQERTLQQLRSGKVERQMRLVGNAENAAELARLAKEVDDLTTQLDEVRGKIRETSPRYATLTQPQPLSVPAMQALLDDDTLLLEFALGTERSYVWAVTNNTLMAYVLPPRATIEKLCSEVYALLTAAQPQPAESPQSRLLRIKQANASYWPKAAALSQLLLSPLAAQLGKKRLLIVSDGALQQIPFAALPVAKSNGQRTTDNGQPLIVNHDITYLPSASILSVLRQERSAPPPSWRDSLQRWFRQPSTAPRALASIAILADPVFEKDDPRLQMREATARGKLVVQTREVDLSDENLQLNRLRATADEAVAIQQAAGTQAFLLKTGTEVNRALLEGETLQPYSILHFATHGYWDSERPELSGLVLSRYDARGSKVDGFLRLSDIYNLRLSHDLVVLSACETALGKDIRGEGLLALTRGFMYAGTPRVIASLWKVEESATVELMKHFYRQLLREKRPPAAALRAAQLTLWQQDPTSAPYDWAAFELQGEYR